MHDPEEREGVYETPGPIFVGDLFDAIGVGRFHYVTTVIVALICGAEAMEIFLLTFLRHNIITHFNIPEEQFPILTSTVFFGMLLGAFICGLLADLVGRRASFLFSVLLAAGGGFVTCFAPSFEVLVLCRFFVGIGAGGGHVGWSFLLEIIPRHNRERYVACGQSAWTWGVLVQTVFAYLLKDSDWRWLVIVTAVPLCVCFVSCLFMPESPRFLLAKNKPEKALAVMRRIIRWNDPAVPFSGQVTTAAAPAEGPSSFAGRRRSHLSYVDLRKADNLALAVRNIAAGRAVDLRREPTPSSPTYIATSAGAPWEVEEENKESSERSASESSLSSIQSEEGGEDREEEVPYAQVGGDNGGGGETADEPQAQSTTTESPLRRTIDVEEDSHSPMSAVGVQREMERRHSQPRIQREEHHHQHRPHQHQQHRLDITTTTAADRSGTAVLAEDEIPHGALKKVWYILTTKSLRRLNFSLWILWASVASSYYGIIILTTNAMLQEDEYLSIFIASLGELPVYPLLGWCARRFGRQRPCQVLPLMGIVLLLLYSYLMHHSHIKHGGLPTPNDSLTILVMFALRLVILLQFDIVYLYSPECYATPIRATATGLCSMAARITSALAPYICYNFNIRDERLTSFSDAALIFSGILFLGFIAASFVPCETKGVDMDDDERRRVKD